MAKSPGRMPSSTMKVTRSSKSSCWPPTRRWLSTFTEKEILFLRRIHAAPSPIKLRDLTTFVRELGIECENLASRFEIKRVLEQVTGDPEEQAVNYAVLRSMQKAVYGPEPEQHYALNMTHYCHFTSPIRRYPDLTVHRLLDRTGCGPPPPSRHGRTDGDG